MVREPSGGWTRDNRRLPRHPARWRSAGVHRWNPAAGAIPLSGTGARAPSRAATGWRTGGGNRSWHRTRRGCAASRLPRLGDTEVGCRGLAIPRIDSSPIVPSRASIHDGTPFLSGLHSNCARRSPPGSILACAIRRIDNADCLAVGCVQNKCDGGARCIQGSWGAGDS